MRFANLQDSTVCIGAAARGRSGAAALRGMQRRSLPHVLGAGLQVGDLKVPTATMPADGPSRGRPPPGQPAAGAAAPWVEAWLGGQTDGLAARLGWRGVDVVRRANQLPRRQGDHRSPRDSGLGEESSANSLADGPRPAGQPRAPLPRAEECLSRDEARLRARMLQQVTPWVEERAGCSIAVLARGGLEDARFLDEVLTEWVREHHERGRSRGEAQAMVLGICGPSGRYPALRGQLAETWQTLRVWESLHEVQHHVPMPAACAMAMVAWALEQGLLGFAVCVWLGFVAALRPQDIRGLVRRDVRTPADLARAGRGDGFVVVRKPKRRQFATTARKQHVRVTEAALLELLEAWLPALRDDDPIWTGSEGQFATQFARACGAFGLVGLTPASLRAGGLTWRYVETADLVHVSWVARHKKLETLESYVQEAVCDEYWAALRPTQRRMVEEAAETASEQVDRVLALLR